MVVMMIIIVASNYLFTIFFPFSLRVAPSSKLVRKVKKLWSCRSIEVVDKPVWRSCGDSTRIFLQKFLRGQAIVEPSTLTTPNHRTTKTSRFREVSFARTNSISQTCRAKQVPKPPCKSGGFKKSRAMTYVLNVTVVSLRQREIRQVTYDYVKSEQRSNFFRVTSNHNG